MIRIFKFRVMCCDRILRWVLRVSFLVCVGFFFGLWVGFVSMMVVIFEIRLCYMVKAKGFCRCI